MRAKRVLATFVTVSPIFNLHVGGHIIGTTTEHPFWAEGQGWTARSWVKTSVFAHFFSK